MKSLLQSEQGDSLTLTVEAVVSESNSLEIDSLTLDPITTYRPGGTARTSESKYFRFSYRMGNRIRHIHIRGGNTDSPIAQAKVAEVRSLLAAGVSPQEIATMIRNPFCGVKP